MNPSKVRVVKADGQRFDDISAGVHSDIIFFNDPSLPLEVGDVVERDLPNGLSEQFEIIDPDFHPDNAHCPAHFQAKAQRRPQIPKRRSEVVNVTYNLHGANSRVNIHSEDNSLNISASKETVFDDMRQFIRERVDASEQTRVLALVDQMDEASAFPARFRETYLQFVSVAADHLGLLSPFLPLLSEYLK